MMSIERNRVNDLFKINPLLFDSYLTVNLSYEATNEFFKQIEHSEEFLFRLGQFYLHKEDYSAFISFDLIIDTIYIEVFFK